MIKKIKVFLTAILLVCVAALAAGCATDTADENKKYDVAIKVVCQIIENGNAVGYPMHEVEFAPGESEKTIKINWTGAPIRFYVYEYKLVGHPSKNEWVTPDYYGSNVFSSDCFSFFYNEELGEYQDNGKSVPKKTICERGKYLYTFDAESTSNIWNYRSVKLFIYIK